MNTLRTIISLTILCFATAAFAQQTPSLLFKLEKISEHTYGVFVQPGQNIDPSGNTTTGSGQVTLVAPVGFDYANFENFGGTWVENARVDGPVEAPNSSYISFGFVTDTPKLSLYASSETLLFSFDVDTEFDGSFSLFENGADVFSVPNSYQSNPGNDLGIIDYGSAKGIQFYTYAGNLDAAQSAQAILASNNEEE